VRPSRCLTRCPPQYLKAPHQLLAFVRRCQAPPERGQHCRRVRWWRIRPRSQRELALSLPAAEPIERLVAIGDDAIARSPSVMAHPPTTSEFPEPLTARADIDITAHRFDGLIIIEVERALVSRSPVGRVRPISTALQAGRDLLHTCRSAARELRGSISFTRVMIYRFLGDGSRRVIAEDKDAGFAVAPPVSSGLEANSASRARRKDRRNGNRIAFFL
jgi:hypothetical protein